MVTFKESSRFYGRTSAGKHQLDVGEIPTAFVQSAKLPEMLRAFVLDRLTKLLDDAASISLIDGPIAAVHFVSISAMLGSHKIDPRDVEHPQSLNFAPFGKDGLERINLDGYLSLNTQHTHLAPYKAERIFPYKYCDPQWRWYRVGRVSFTTRDSETA
ncbi:hypothetical protein K227x_56240 [Rubripirellula lacrimiformis]|uniref:Uncharacterized protein n=1 Tax=Rubripirellula lacrimiformis TaxID=1930273 RepID=A0A517NJ88_9BACT|nr:hypothetical protein K227x_56240 [Rubripirellula lacrimiformis]